jgi:CubicO group peptidase (beta-lactamase class C family)
MKRAAALLALVLMPVLASAATRSEKIDALLNSYHKLRQFNGSALVAEGGKVILKKGYGFANMEWQIPNAPDTKFRLGSITKQFTAMVIMQLVAEGKIGLDEPLTKYLPDYRSDTGGKVTIRHLLTHTSGIPSYTNLPGFIQNETRDPYKVADFVKKYASGDLAFEPGSRFAYNNSGYFLLGAIIERITGKPYEAALKQRIFDPVGMKDTGYDHANTVLSRRASGYVIRPGGYDNAPYLDMSVPYAAGALYSTVEDLYRWDRALYAHTLLAAEHETVMFTPFLQDYAFGWTLATRKLSDQKTEVAVITHAGGINGFSTTIVRVPKTQDLVVLLDNTSRGDKLDGITDRILGILRGIDPPAPKPSLVDDLANSDDVKASLARYRQRKASYDVSESEINRFGYQLLARERIADAIEVFRFNVEEFPNSWNVYDSLAEAYAMQGARDLAIANYKKSVELNPQNRGGVDALKRLEQPPSDRTATKVTP